MIYYTVDIDDLSIDEVCHQPCGVFDSEEKVMDFIKKNKEHLRDRGYYDDEEEYKQMLNNQFYVVHIWELNKYRKFEQSKVYKIFRKDL